MAGEGQVNLAGGVEKERAAWKNPMDKRTAMPEA